MLKSIDIRGKRVLFANLLKAQNLEAKVCNGSNRLFESVYELECVVLASI